jgi:hypothetical protein
MTNKKIKTFKELYEAVENLKLFPMRINRDDYANRFNFYINDIDYTVYHFDKENIFCLYHNKKVFNFKYRITPKTKNPQRIYNIIKEIKECEEE